MKKLLLLLILTSIMLPAAIAITETNPLTPDSTDSGYTAKVGMRIYALQNITINSITKASGATATTAYILDASKSVLATSGTFSGNTATFSPAYNLTEGTTYYLAADAGGGSFDTRRKLSVSYPQAGTSVNWTGGLIQSAGNPTDDSTQAHMIDSFDYGLVENNFTVTAYNSYTGISLQNFNATITFNGTTTNYTTTNGAVVTPLDKTAASVNVTINAHQYFSNSTIGHDKISNLAQEITPWTEIYALNSTSQLYVEPFNLTYEGEIYESVNETVKIPLFNQTAEITINATDFALAINNVTASPYLRNYTFDLYTDNTVSIRFLDEETGSLINTTEINAFFTGGIISYNYSTSNGTLLVELITPQSYTITYTGSGYDQREYDFILTNRTYNEIDLYLLNTNSSDLILLTVEDTLLDPLAGYTVFGQKKNLSGTNYYTVETCSTDSRGECIMSLDLYFTTYRFLVQNPSGTTVFTSNDQKITGTEITLQVQITDDELETIENIYEVTGDVTYNTGLEEFSFTWTDSNGLNTQGCLEVNSVYRGVTETLSTQCSTASSGTITYSAPTNVTYTYEARGYVIIDTNEYTIDSLSIAGDQEIGVQIGLAGLFIFGFLVIGIAAFTGLFNPVIPPAIIIVSLIIFNMLGFITVGTTAIASLAVGGILIIYLSRS